jgi:hypothetical protein
MRVDDKALNEGMRTDQTMKKTLLNSKDLCCAPFIHGLFVDE